VISTFRREVDKICVLWVSIQRVILRAVYLVHGLLLLYCAFSADLHHNIQACSSPRSNSNRL